MVFSSLPFIFAFLVLTLLLYYSVPYKFKNAILLICSLVFYAWGEPIYIVLIIYSILFNYSFGLLMDEYEDSKRKLILVFAIIVNIFILFFFKYYGFVLRNINSVMGLSIPVKELALPIGVSFYTFQALSYIIDLYKGRFKSQKNLVSFALYITMFPQLIAGPIVRYKDIAAALSNRKININCLGKGAERFIQGLGKKVLLANVMGSLFELCRNTGTDTTVVTAWIGAIAYTFQIYFDFSGYSDMAIGLGKMLGFDFCENFDHPYTAGSITEFWRRWHISLGSWFREYVYIPLGGNKKGAFKHIINIMIVWLLTGLWHGAAWNFVLWGLYYGILLLIEKFIIFKVKWIPKCFMHIYTGVLVTIGWVIFSSESVLEISNTLVHMFSGTIYNSYSLYILGSYWIMLAICALFSTSLPKLLCEKMFATKIGRGTLLVLNMLVFVLCIMYLVTDSYNPFLYFQF